tara:strand:- start:20 stop:169 length:150 start_codon:yes stop_codon:yes gene_type:complete
MTVSMVAEITALPKASYTDVVEPVGALMFSTELVGLGYTEMFRVVSVMF